jgi:serine/threonine-protein kinase
LSTPDHIAPDVATLAEPAALLHFRLEQRLGEGGYGEVFAAWDSRLQRRVAIKRVKTWTGPNKDASLLKEARLAASIGHPAFVKIYSFEADGDGHAIVMELIPGPTLRQMLDSGALPLERALEITLQLAEAMQAAHASALVHGDLKPSNLIIEPSGALRILDLGLSFHDDAQATTSVMALEQLGTIAYMAPECLLGNPPGRQSDIYALGVILYELSTGRRPHGPLAGLALAAAQMQSSSDTWAFPSTLPVGVVELIQTLAARRPERRPPDMAAAARMIAACANASGAAPADAAAVVAGEAAATATAAPTLSAPPPPPRTRRLALLAAALAVTGLLAWKLADSFLPLPPALSTYSESRAIEQTLNHLKQFDRPDRLDAAEAELNTILARNPEQAAAVAGMSLVYSFRYASTRQDNTWRQRADAAAQQALRLAPSLALAQVAQAWVKANQRDFKAALADCEQALTVAPDDYFAHLCKATFLTELHRYDDAVAWLQTAMQRQPDERVFADALGVVYFRQANWAGAEQAFRKSIALEPDSVLAYANLNAALLKLNRGDEALKVIQQGLQVRPTAALYDSLGNALFGRNDYTGAAAAFQHAVTPPIGNPNNYVSWANLGDALQWLPGQQEQARAAYRKAIALLEPRLISTPKDATLLSRMGVYAARTGDEARTLDLLARALAAAPDDAHVAFRAALAYELLSKRELALRQLAQARRLGYPASAIENEPDFVALRRDVRYH